MSLNPHPSQSPEPNQNNEAQAETLSAAHHDYQAAMNAYASFKVSNKALSEDLVQDTFIKTWSYLVRGGEIKKMKAFLYHVLNGLIIDEYRKRKVSSLDVMIEGGYEPAIEETNRQANIFDGAEAVQLIELLPPAYKEVMRMRYVDDLSLAEIAVQTGKTKNSVAVQAHRGLEKLKELYLNQ